MAFNPNVRIPWGYGTSFKTLAEVSAILRTHYHPEYNRRILSWLSYKGGAVGVGSTWRAGGAQPNRPGFAPEGKSFHQDQNYADGFYGACAVDLVVAVPGKVHRAPRWDEVPAQGSAEAVKWGVHCNVSSEPWHMQPVEIDGWQTWWNAGRPAPRANYPLPGTAPAPAPAPPATAPVPSGVLDMVIIARDTTGPTIWFSPDGGVTRHAVRNLEQLNLLFKIGAIDAKSGNKITAWQQSAALTPAQLNHYIGKAV